MQDTRGITADNRRARTIAQDKEAAKRVV
jgi:hypothetical protein